MHELLSPDDDVRGPARDAFALLGQPAVLRGLVRHWPIVASRRELTDSAPRHPAPPRQRHPRRRHHDAPEVEGRVFYNDAMTGFNFIRNRLPISAIAEQLTRYATFETHPPSPYKAP